jgi:hypothetical protein
MYFAAPRSAVVEEVVSGEMIATSSEHAVE